MKAVVRWSMSWRSRERRFTQPRRRWWRSDNKFVACYSLHQHIREVYWEIVTRTTTMTKYYEKFKFTPHRHTYVSIQFTQFVYPLSNRYHDNSCLSPCLCVLIKCKSCVSNLQLCHRYWKLSQNEHGVISSLVSLKQENIHYKKMQKTMELSIKEQRDAIGQRWIRKLSSVLAGIAMRIAVA